MACIETSRIAEPVGGYRDDLSELTPYRARQPGESIDMRLVELICDAVAHGDHLPALGERGMTKADAARGSTVRYLPSYGTLVRWFREDETAFMYARARIARADWRADRMERITAEVHAGTLDPQAARVIIDADKWLMAKENPRIYGERLELTGRDGGPIEVARVDDGELARMVALLLAQAGETPMIEAHGSEAQVTDIEGDETDNSTESG